MQITKEELQQIKNEAVKEYVKAKYAEEEAEALKQNKSPYEKGWIQLNKEVKGKVLWLIKNHVRAYGLLNFLIYHMNKKNAVIASYKLIQEALGLSRNTVSASIKILKDHNFIHTYKVGTATAYATNSDIAWTSYGKNLKYAKLTGNILIAESEQKISTEKIEVIKIEEPPSIKKPIERKRKN